MKKIIHISFLLLITACSANQVRLQTELIPSSNSSLFELEEAISVKASNASATKLKAGTTWQEIGRIEHGVVFKTKDQVVIVNSFNVHEGYIVVNNAEVVGYYLPIEKTFIKSKPVSINLVKMEQNNEI